MSIGMRIEALKLDGFAEGESLSAAERAEVVEYAAHFEECSRSRDQLVALGDKDLIDVAYWAMADYARGQV